MSKTTSPSPLQPAAGPGSGHTSGSNNAKLYVDSIEEAKSLGGQRPARARRTIEAFALRHVEQCERMLRQYGRWINEETKKNPRWIPPNDFVEGFEGVSKTLERAWRAIRAARADEKKLMDGLSPEELDVVLVANLVRIARTLAPEHKRTILTCWFGKLAADKLMEIEVPPGEVDDEGEEGEGGEG